MAVALLVTALLLGGLGVRFPLIDASIQLVAVIVLLHFALDRPQPGRFRGAALPFLLAGSVALVPLLQMVPLPPELWRAVPGRDLWYRLLELAEIAPKWRPLSLDPAATERSFLALLPGLAAFVAIVHQPASDRRKLVAVVVGAALFSAILGALQVAGGRDSGFNLTGGSHSGYPIGLLRNRNHQADLLLIGLVLVCVIGRLRSGETARAEGRLFIAAIALVFAAGVIATTSRVGMFLLPFALGSGMLILFGVRPKPKALLIAGGVIALSAFIVSQSSAFQRAAARFDFTTDLRFDFWRDTMWAIGEYAPWGSGLGTFVPVFQTAENLNLVNRFYVNNAHNDYLELMLEAGAPAIVLLLAFLGFILASGYRLARKERGSKDKILAAGALISILLIMVHSAFDYPLRVLSLEAVFGLLCGLLVASCWVRRQPGALAARAALDAGGPAGPNPSILTWIKRASALALALMLVYRIAIVGLTDEAIRSKHYERALAWSPDSAEASRRLAARKLSQRQAGNAERLARNALDQSPLAVSAYGSLGFVWHLQGKGQAANQLLMSTATLGWRDVPVQVWLASAALATRNYRIGVERTDALLRLGKLKPVLTGWLRKAAMEPEGARAIAMRLAERPPWRNDYLRKVERLQPGEYAGHEAVLAHLAATGAPPIRQDLAEYLKALVRSKRFLEARRVWLRHAAPKSTSLVTDGDFDGLSGDPPKDAVLPFDWNIEEVSGASATAELPAEPLSGPALRVASSGSSAGTLVAQLLVLRPGSYRVAVSARPEEGAGLNAVSWVVRCADRPLLGASGDVSNAVGDTGGWRRIAFDFSVPAGCAAQRLELRTNEGGGKGAATFDRMSLQPL